MDSSMGAPTSASSSTSTSESGQGDRTRADAPDRKPEAPDYTGTKHKVRVYDKDMEVDYEELRRGYQLKQASHQALQEAAQTKKQAESILNRIKSKDRKAFAEAMGGEDALRQWAEDLLIDDLEYKSLPQSERELREERARRAELEQWKKSYEERQAAEQRQAMDSKVAETLDNEITEAFTAFGAKPTPYLVARVADEMASALEQGRTLTPKQALDRVDRAATSEIQEMPPDKLMSRLTQAQIEYVRKHLVDQVMGQQPRRVRQSTPTTVRRSSSQPMTIDEAIKAKTDALKRG